MDFIHHQRGIFWNLSLKGSSSTALISCFPKSIQLDPPDSRKKMSWYSANRAQAAAWFLSDHLSMPDKSSCWKSSSFLCSTDILISWIPCISSNFSRVLEATSTGGTAFATTTWVTLMPLAVVIGMAIRFFTTTATHFSWNHFDVWVHYTEAVGQMGSITPFRDWVTTCILFPRTRVVIWPCIIYYFGWKSVYLLPLCHFDCLCQIGWIHCLVCGSFPLNQKTCSPTCQQSCYPQSIQGNNQLINFPSLITLMIWFMAGVTRVTGTWDPKTVESGMTRATCSLL